MNQMSSECLHVFTKSVLLFRVKTWYRKLMIFFFCSYGKTFPDLQIVEALKLPYQPYCLLHHGSSWNPLLVMSLWRHCIHLLRHPPFMMSLMSSDTGLGSTSHTKWRWRCFLWLVMRFNVSKLNLFVDLTRLLVSLK